VQTDPLRELLERAFCSARVTGKRDWNRMLVAVLKNRLLQLTNRSFREEDFGATSLLELLARHRDLVAVDHTARPVMIEWLGAPGGAGATSGTGRVRADLWRAILDFSSGMAYEWDPVTRLARPVQDAEPRRRLPTVDAAALARWRDAFVRAHDETLAGADDRQRLRTWAALSHGSQGLPRALRSRWNEHLKREVVARLTSWFTATEHPLPELIEP
jgi:hypothetical protein